ncbi:MAG: hypothetical protein AB8H03_21770 [Saprospiraceae bacterium]
MKNQILDEPIRDSFFDYLEKGEKVLWEGKPVINYNFTIVVIWFILFLSPSYVSIYQSSKTWLSLSMFLILIVFPFIYANFKQKRKQREVKYAITQNRIFFKQKVNKKIQINSISFEHIPRVYLNNNTSLNTGDISFLLKKPAKGKFHTYHIDNNQALELPTFQQVENPKTIIKLLQQQIKKSNSS